MQNLQAPVIVLYQGSTTFYPIAVIAIQDAIDHAHFSTMDMAAQNAVMPALFSFVGYGDFKISHVIQRCFDFLLEKSGQ
jgi:hypothetical protein